MELFFENLKTSDLLNIIESDETLLEPVIWAFCHNHGQKLIKISGSFFFLGRMSSTNSFGVEESYLDIQNYELTLKVFNTFGYSIHKLHVNYVGMGSLEIVEINRLIGEKCAGQLTELGATFRNNELNALLTSSIFPNVETVKLFVGRLRENIDLNQIFPQLKSLTLHSAITSAAGLIDRHFPHLIDLTIEFFNRPGLTEQHFETMLQKNRQITSITVDHCSLNFLEAVHKHLPHLESLCLNNLRSNLFDLTTNVPVIRFESVKQFTLQVLLKHSLSPSIIPFEFGDRLEEVKLIWTHFRIGDQWTAFIERNTNIHKLTVDYLSGDYNDYACLTDLDIPKLKEIELQGIDLNHRDEIDHFFRNVRKWKHLERIHFVDAWKNQTDMLRTLSAGWEMDEFENADDSDDWVNVRFYKIASCCGSC